MCTNMVFVHKVLLVNSHPVCALCSRSKISSPSSSNRESWLLFVVERTFEDGFAKRKLAYPLRERSPVDAYPVRRPLVLDRVVSNFDDEKGFVEEDHAGELMQQPVTSRRNICAQFEFDLLKLNLILCSNFIDESSVVMHFQQISMAAVWF